MSHSVDTSAVTVKVYATNDGCKQVSVTGWPAQKYISTSRVRQIVLGYVVPVARIGALDQNGRINIPVLKPYVHFLWGPLKKIKVWFHRYLRVLAK